MNNWKSFDEVYPEINRWILLKRKNTDELEQAMFLDDNYWLFRVKGAKYRDSVIQALYSHWSYI